MDTPIPPLDARRDVLVLLSRLRAAERAVDEAHAAAMRMIAFEQHQLLAALEQLPKPSGAEPGVAFRDADREPWTLRAFLSAMAYGFVSAVKPRTA